MFAQDIIRKIVLKRIRKSEYFDEAYYRRNAGIAAVSRMIERLETRDSTGTC